MSQFTIHTRQTAPLESQEILDAAEGKFGFIPNLIGVLAEAPVAAKAYFSMTKFVSLSSLTQTEKHVVWFAINEFHICQYCMAAHTAMAMREVAKKNIIDSARNGKPYQDDRLEKLRNFTREILHHRGNLPEDVIANFLASGFTKQNVLEIVVAIANKTISNYVNHLAQTPLDEEFADFAWKEK